MSSSTDATIDLEHARGWGTQTYGPGRDVSVPADMARHLVKIGQAEYSDERARREAAAAVPMSKTAGKDADAHVAPAAEA